MPRRTEPPAELREFGRRLQQLREAAGKSQGEFAPLASLKVETLQRWEQGRSDPGLLGLLLLAKTLGVRPAMLLESAPAGWKPLHVRHGRPPRSTKGHRPKRGGE